MYSVLNNKKKIKFLDSPYPYLVIDDALPKKYYEELNQSFPPYDKIINGAEYKKNFAYRYNAAQSLSDSAIPNIWREFISFHTSFKFVEDFYNIFKNSISKILRFLVV